VEPLRSPRLADLTYEEAEAIIDKGAWALLPCGATEAHGPHLPLSTDVIIAENAAVGACEVLARQGVHALVLPPVAYAVTEYASEFAGTVTLPLETATALVHDIVMGAIQTGFLGAVLCNAHLEPGNLSALATAAERARDKGVKVAFVDVTKKPHALRLGEEFKSGACHAGSYETSLVLAAQPFLVREDVAASLPDNPISLSRAIRDGKTTFKQAGGPRAYFGYPSKASEAQGEQLYGELSAIFADAILGLSSQ
jgi:creatinine amidohydrolase